MSSIKDYYHILQVHPKAEQDVIEAAYKKLAKKYHPDVSHLNSSQENMQLINEAYSILSQSNERTLYDKKWDQLHHKNFTPIASTKKKYTTHKETNESQVAFLVVRDYFECIKLGKLKEAYQLISKTDRLHISLDDFIHWQKSVNRIFKLDEFTIKRGMQDEDSLSVDSKPLIYRFVITTIDYNCIMDRYEQDILEKKVVYEGKKWFIQLGNVQLKKSVERFEALHHLVQAKGVMKEFVDSYGKYDGQTGLINKKGILDSLSKEVLRYRRYNRRFCIMIVGIRFSKHIAGGTHDEAFLRMASTLDKKTRSLDSVARWSDRDLFILMPETSLEAGLLAAQKIKNTLLVEFKGIYQKLGISFPMAIDVFQEDLPTAIDRLDYLFEMSLSDNEGAIQSIRGRY